MSSVPRPGSLSAPPQYERRYALALVSAPAPEPPVVQIQLLAPQPVVIKAAPMDSLNSTFEYWIEGEDIP